MSKLTTLSARLEVRVAPSVLSEMDTEIGRLRMGSLMFGNRKPKQAAIVMTAIKAFMALPSSQRDALYQRFLPSLEGIESKAENN